MSFRETNIIVYGISMLVTSIGYAVVMSNMVDAGQFNGPDAMSLLGKSVLILMGCAIVLTIALVVLSTIIFTIRQKAKNGENKQPKFELDERDQMIELRVTRITEVITGLGYVVSMIALAMGQTPFVTINMIVASFMLGAISGQVIKLFIYRRGY